MSDKYRIYSGAQLHASKKENYYIIMVKGCNGERHLLKISKVFLDENDNLDSKFPVTNVDLGLCDKEHNIGVTFGEFIEMGQTIKISRPEKT